MDDAKNHLMNMDNVKLFAKKWKKKELEALIHTVIIYNKGIGMEFSIGKYVMLIMKIGKRHLTDRMDLPNPEKIRTLGKKGNL